MIDKDFIKAIKEKMTRDYKLLHNRKDKNPKEEGKEETLYYLLSFLEQYENYHCNEPCSIFDDLSKLKLRIEKQTVCNDAGGNRMWSRIMKHIDAAIEIIKDDMEICPQYWEQKMEE